MVEVFKFFNTPEFLCLTILVSLFLKTVLLTILIPQAFRCPSSQKSCFLLIIVLVASMIGDFSWGIKLIRLLFIPTLSYSAVLFFVRIAWACFVIQYHALALFVRNLTEKRLILSQTQKILIYTSISFCIYFFYLTIFSNDLSNEAQRHNAMLHTTSQNFYHEISMMRLSIMYILICLVIPTIFTAIARIRKGNLPKILHHQVLVLLRCLIIPYLAAELLTALNFEFVMLKTYKYATVGISAILIAYIVYYCIRNIMGLRFLNFTSHVESKHSFNFVDNFKIILEQLSFATSTVELIQITSTFFKEAYNIPTRKITLHIRKPMAKEEFSKTHEIDALVEEFCTTHSSGIYNYINQHKILIYDELAFSNFYIQETTQTALLEFLGRINAEIFLPIFEKARIIGFIIVDANARPNHLYSNVERDEMLVFASYLGNIINLLRNRNLETLILQEKELKEELYKKQQEICNYRESIRSFLKNNKHKEIGIIFYKYRRFIYANQTAKEMVKININAQEGHPISRALKHVARQVQEYKSPQTLMVPDLNGNRLVISGVPNLEQNNVILTISHPDIADIISKQLGLLKDPSKWDYVLYLETTKPGQLINQLIPGNGETLLNFKISLLQTALSKKATLLEMPQEDLLSMVELLHHISMREILQIITLHTPTNPLEMGSKLFGINPIFGPTSHKPLLEKLDGNGTLFIQNIEYLDRETQEHLAEFLRYGYYHIYKSEQKLTTDIRIICSANQSLQHRVESGIFSKSLFNELKKCSICLPSLEELPDRELNDLAQGYTDQAIKTNDFKNLLELTDKERIKIMGNRPVSLQELKNRVQQLLINKSKKNNIEQEIQFNPAYEISDPELIQASQLGKHALRDHKIMVTLWNKFKNQNKIAAFLGVNRSSVNRRCKEYNIDI
jgi:sigma-54 interacting transcriptional regulator